MTRAAIRSFTRTQAQRARHCLDRIAEVAKTGDVTTDCPCRHLQAAAQFFRRPVDPAFEKPEQFEESFRGVHWFSSIDKYADRTCPQLPIVYRE